jgi:hypothetical protein
LANEIALGGTWIQTSYNTESGVHKLGGTPLRKNCASVGFFYDSELDAFIPPKPFNSWKLNKQTCRWESPIPYPEGEIRHIWDESSQTWIEFQ